jgi:hypothetical protein
LVTFDEFQDEKRKAGEQAILADDSIIRWSEDAGLGEGWLRLAWEAFVQRYRGQPKTYADWRNVFRRAVRGNWAGLWTTRNGELVLTPIGETARRAFEAKRRRESSAACETRVAA